jgi:hypothetical protein
MKDLSRKFATQLKQECTNLGGLSFFIETVSNSAQVQIQQSSGVTRSELTHSLHRLGGTLKLCPSTEVNYLVVMGGFSPQGTLTNPHEPTWLTSKLKN